MTFEPVYPPPAATAAAAVDEYLPMADGNNNPTLEEEANFPYFGIEGVESDDVFLQDLLEFVRD